MSRATACVPPQFVVLEGSQICKASMINRKNQKETRCGLELSESILGHARVTGLLQDARLNDICTKRTVHQSINVRCGVQCLGLRADGFTLVGSFHDSEPMGSFHGSCGGCKLMVFFSKSELMDHSHLFSRSRATSACGRPFIGAGESGRPVGAGGARGGSACTSRRSASVSQTVLEFRKVLDQCRLPASRPLAQKEKCASRGSTRESDTTTKDNHTAGTLTVAHTQFTAQDTWHSWLKIFF